MKISSITIIVLVLFYFYIAIIKFISVDAFYISLVLLLTAYIANDIDIILSKNKKR